MATSSDEPFFHLCYVMEQIALANTALFGYIYRQRITMKIEIEKEDDGRWIAEVTELPGVLAYGATREEAIAKVEALALRIIAERLDHGERIPELNERFALPA
jgi:predicted RNase H-like HicB family nuclease